MGAMACPASQEKVMPVSIQTMQRRAVEKNRQVELLRRSVLRREEKLREIADLLSQVAFMPGSNTAAVTRLRKLSARYRK